MEVLLTHAKPRLVRLAPFRVGPRPERQTGRARDEVLAVLPELVDERGVFTMRQVQARLNPDDDARRGWAVEKAVRRMTGTSGTSLPLIALGSGRYQVAHGRNAVGLAGSRG